MGRISKRRGHGYERVSENDVLEALKSQGSKMIDLYKPDEIELIRALAQLCKNRSTYRFSYPNNTQAIMKYTNRSEEYNIINILQVDTEKNRNTYYFDYAFCIFRDLPTHYLKGTRKIDKKRSRATGEPIRRVAQLSDEQILSVTNGDGSQ